VSLHTLMSNALKPLFYSIQFLRDVRDAFGTSFKIIPADKSGQSSQLLYSCYGTGYVNTNRTLG
jgi:RNA 3'-terminal phosphate cyclase-like protein